MGQTTILLALDGAQNIEDVRLDGQEFVFTTLSDASDIPELEGGEFAFLDWVLPTMSGLELCRLLRATDRGGGFPSLRRVRRSHLRYAVRKRTIGSGRRRAVRERRASTAP